MSARSLVIAVVFTTFGLVLAGWLAPGATLAAGEDSFTEAELADQAMIAEGRKIWKKTCRHCHSRRGAYPGKAPKLKPARYKPGFVYRRVTKGFRSMPSWKKRLSLEQRRAVTVYIMSRAPKKR